MATALSCRTRKSATIAIQSWLDATRALSGTFGALESCHRWCSVLQYVRHAASQSDTKSPQQSSLLGTSAASRPLPSTKTHPQFTDLCSSYLKESHIGKYYPIDEGIIPEAFDQWYTNRDARRGRSVPIDGGGEIKPLPSFVAGCAGLQHELAISRYPYIMYRAAYAAVWDMVENGQDEDDRRLLVKGATGSGKSVFLAATAEYLRQKGWIVMYVPDCNDVTFRNMSYSANPETGMYDTRDAAQNILRAVLEAHGDKLRNLPQQVEGGSGTLYDLVSLTDAASDAQLCNALVRLKLELYRLPRSVPSAVIIDRYNALFWKTEMYAPERLNTRRPARRLDAQELTLGANLRVLSDGDIGHTAVLGGVSVGAVPQLPLGLGEGDDVRHAEVTMPLMNVAEMGSMLQWYRYVEAISASQPISENGVHAAWQLTQGDGHEVRRNLHFLLPYSKDLDNLDALGELYSNVSLR